MMVNEFERDAVSDVIILVDSRAVSETGPVVETLWYTALERSEPHPALPIQA